MALGCGLEDAVPITTTPSRREVSYMKLDFTPVNLPFSASDVDYDESKLYFEQTISLTPGMLLDCDTEYGPRGLLLVGHINRATGTCGCCPNNITFVYGYAVIDLDFID